MCNVILQPEETYTDDRLDNVESMKYDKYLEHIITTHKRSIKDALEIRHVHREAQALEPNFVRMLDTECLMKYDIELDEAHNKKENI